MMRDVDVFPAIHATLCRFGEMHYINFSPCCKFADFQESVSCPVSRRQQYRIMSDYHKFDMMSRTTANFFIARAPVLGMGNDALVEAEIRT